MVHLKIPQSRKNIARKLKLTKDFSVLTINNSLILNEHAGIQIVSVIQISGLIQIFVSGAIFTRKIRTISVRLNRINLIPSIKYSNVSLSFLLLSFFPKPLGFCMQ